MASESLRLPGRAAVEDVRPLSIQSSLSLQAAEHPLHLSVSSTLPKLKGASDVIDVRDWELFRWSIATSAMGLSCQQDHYPSNRVVGGEGEEHVLGVGEGG